MNERIKLLAEQAEGTKKHVPAVWQFYDHELEKFAQLVVEDVFCQIANERFEVYEPVIQAVKKHFGVE